MKVLLLLLALTVPAAAQTTYYQAPVGYGAMIPRTDLGTLPASNTPDQLPTVELLNDAPGSDQAFIGTDAQPYQFEADQYGNSGYVIARFILNFTHKINANPKLIFESNIPLFHLLDGQGGPIWCGYAHPGFYAWNGFNAYPGFTIVQNWTHSTTHNLMMGIALPWPSNVLPAGKVLIDALPSGARNRMWVIAE